MGGGPGQAIPEKMQVPPGISLLHRVRGRPFSFFTYQTSVLVLTFISYTCFHAARKPPSIVKGVLDPDDNGLTSYTPGYTFGVAHGNSTLAHSTPPQLHSGNQSVPDLNARAKSLVNKSTDLLGGLAAGWPPFSGKLGKGLLGEMDIAFLSCYAVGMYFAGHFGDRVDLRLFLSVGMVGSGLFVCLFGMAYFWDIHVLAYFLLVQMLGGLFQATGWPSVVSIMANWYGKKRRGLIMGIWNAHTSVGNILGSLIASVALTWGWGWAFLLPGFTTILGGIILYFFLVPEPDVLGLKIPSYPGDGSPDVQDACSQGLLEETDGKCRSISLPLDDTSDGASSSSGSASPSSLNKGFTLGDLTVPAVVAPPSVALPTGKASSPTDSRRASKASALPESESAKLLDEALPTDQASQGEEAIGFLEAWRIPGVASFAMCLFFAKLVAYTFLYWLPFYIGHTEIAGTYMSSAMAGITSTVFDVGGVFGGILAGHLSDYYHAQATVASLFMGTAIPCMALYFFFGHLSVLFNIGLLALVGFLVNGPYALITCAVSADLGQHSSLKGNARALATVTAIIDGTGSVGAAIGPFLTGLISEIGGQAGWAAVFLMLMLASLAAVLCLVRLVRAEVEDWRHGWLEVATMETTRIQRSNDCRDNVQRETADDKV